MRGSIMTLVALAIAAPAAAIVARVVLPAPFQGMDYVDARCESAADGRLEIVRVQADGKLLRMTRTSGLLAGTASRVEAGRILRALDRARFARRIVPRIASPRPNALDCTLLHGGHGRLDVVALAQGNRTKRALQDLFRVLDDVRALGKRAVRPAAMSNDGRLIERKK